MKETFSAQATRRCMPCPVAGTYTVNAKTLRRGERVFIYVHGVSDKGFPLPVSGWLRHREFVPALYFYPLVVTDIVNSLLRIPDTPHEDFVAVARCLGCGPCSTCSKILPDVDVSGKSVAFSAEMRRVGTTISYGGHARITCANPLDVIDVVPEWEFDFDIAFHGREYWVSGIRLANMSLPHPHSSGRGICLSGMILDMASTLFAAGKVKSALGVIFEGMRHIEYYHWKRKPELLEKLGIRYCTSCHSYSKLSEFTSCDKCKKVTCPKCSNQRLHPTSDGDICDFCFDLFERDHVEYTFSDGVVGLGSLVRLGRHPKKDNWSSRMDNFVGRVARVTQICNCGAFPYHAKVDVDRGRDWWYTSCMQIATPVEQYDTSEVSDENV